MQTSRHFCFFIFAAVVAASVACALPIRTFAGGEPANKAGAPRPVRDVERKVYTNDDLGWPAAASPAASAAQAAPTAGALPAAGPTVGVAATTATAPGEPVNFTYRPQQDPRWYAQQTAALEEELASLTSRAQALREFRSTSSGLPTGLVLDAPCEGITTDNLIAQLDLRRRQIAQQLGELDDTAHRNGLQPGAVAEARALAQIQPSLSAEQQRAALTGAYRQRADELAQARGVMVAMQAHTAAQRMTLLMPVPGRGGNMTADLLQRLDARANALQSQLRTIEDEARRAGAPPSLLR